ncbi:hemagglutinin repeat-containing protein, partial [Haemophilus parainfluenzae]|uniref:hemagglutinin repeat-containing protein n=2 Tax=Haemophilus TaxID=724 RepID=UPI001A9D1849
ESQSISHQKSTVNTGTFNAKARDEKLSFEGVDANAKLMALSGKKGIEIKGVKDEEHQRTENKSVGGSVGVFVGTNGNSYGIGIEGSVNVAKGKSNSDSERWQNSHFTADKIITNSEEGGLNLDAANLKAKRWEADIQNLTVTSRQDTEKYESKQTSASASGSVAYGSGGGGSVSASYSKAKVDYAQVKEQAGISVGEDGMDVAVHHHTQLNGAIIESDADASKNRFKTQSISTTDIENKSEIKTESASISAGSGGVNPMQALSSALSLLGNSHESEHSQTKSAISGNIQIETETPENLTALSRDTKNANQRVEKQDLQKVQERQEMAKVIGEISENAINIATYEEREKINKLGLEKFKLEEQEKALKGQAGNEQQLAAIKQQLTSVQTEITKTQDEIDRAYGIGSEKGMAIRAVTAALQAAAQNDTAGSLVALASPYLNQTIHEMTAGDTAKAKATNLMAHALLSAVEFQVTGKDPLTGAIAGVTGEATAEIIARAYGKPVSELTANEKENISTLSQLAGGLAAALTAKANGTLTEQGGSFLAATSGAETAKRAVENNYLSVADVENLIRELSKAQKEGRDTKPILEKYEGISEENRQQLIACNGNVACETAHLHEMNTGAEELERNLGFFSRMTVYYPNDLNTANRIALSNLVERENAESFSKLSDTTKFGLNLMEAGTAIGLGAVAGSAKAGLSNVKSLINGKNKAYPTSGMDGYKRTNVGDEDYPEGIHFSMNLKNHLIQGEGINQRRGVAGGHNRENFLNTLSQGGGRIVKEESTNVDGITRIHYEIPRLGRDGKPDGTYKAISSPKTVYDPIKFSDHEMLEMGQKAVAKGYVSSVKASNNYLKNYQDSQQINGIKFRYYIDKDTKGVTNVHPE